jgi:hypothetical protein
MSCTLDAATPLLQFVCVRLPIHCNMLVLLLLLPLVPANM